VPGSADDQLKQKILAGMSAPECRSDARQYGRLNQMHEIRRRTGGVALACSVFLAFGAPPLVAQDQTSEAQVSADAALADEGLLSAEELDTLTAPVALFPDALLAQVMMAATFPLDIVKADQFLADNGELTDKERAAAVEENDWDPSVKALAAGFPDLIGRMASNISWTEQMGDAVLAQTDDVFDSVQRLRVQAKSLGYLEDNPAQATTESDEGELVISSKDPEVVYVPQYNPQVVYSTPAPATPTYVVEDDSNLDDLLLTGGLVFGGAMILDEIFDDDDDWDDYWRGPGSIDWDNNDFHPRPGVEIGGDVNINRGDVNIDRDKVNIDRNKVKVDRDKVKVDRDKVTNIDRDKIDRDKKDRDRLDQDRADRDRVGSVTQDRLDAKRDPGFNPDAAKRDEARKKIETRKASGAAVAPLPAQKADRAKAAKAQAKATNRPAAKPVAKPAPAKPVKVNRPATPQPKAKISAPAKVSKPVATKRPTVSRPTASPSKSSSVFKKSGGSRAAAASSRGRSSGGGKRGR
jgi:hypothetical protein